MNSNRCEISVGGKISLWCKVTSLLCSHEFRQSETHFGANFTAVNLTEVKFKTAVSFPCKK